MDLGEKIYNYRKLNNLSQGDLASKLDVSRQSISKWENNTAQPELDKIIKLSEVFNITTDELLKGENITTFEPNKEPNDFLQNNEKNKKHLIGIMLITLGAIFLVFLTLFAGILMGAIVGLPFIISGIIYLKIEKHPGLLCLWLLLLTFDAIFPYITSMKRSNILFTFQWTSGMNYGTLMLDWIYALITLAIILYTAYVFRKISFESIENGKRKLIISIIIFIALVPLNLLINVLILHPLIDNRIFYGVNIITYLQEEIGLLALTYMIINISRYKYYKKYSNF